MVGEADLISDFTDGSGLLLQQLFGPLQADITDEIRGREIGECFQFSVQLPPAEVGLICELLNVELVLRDMALNDSHNFEEKLVVQGFNLHLTGLQRYRRSVFFLENFPIGDQIPDAHQQFLSIEGLQ